MVPDQLEHLTHQELLDLAAQLMWDHHTGFLLGSAAAVIHADIVPGNTLVYMDFCNVHACNHFYGGMDETNARWKASFETRADDTIIKWGGDEIAVLLGNDDVAGYLARLTSAMRANNVYAVIAVVTTSTRLVETITRADRLVTGVKNHLEATGQKPHRDAPYVCLDSHIIYEGASDAQKSRAQTY